jgi:hypothetical protein
VEVHAVGDLIGHHRVGDGQVVHRPVEPQADLGVVDVEPVDGGVAQRSADPVHLVGVDALSYVAFDCKVRQVHVVGAAVCGVPAVEADSGVNRAVGKRGAQGDLVALDDRVPAARAFDRDVVDDDVSVHLEYAVRDEDRLGLRLGLGDRGVERVC